MDIPVEFFITSLVVVLLPGTGVIYTVSIGLFRGARLSLYAAVGCTLGIVPHLLASVLGLAALLHASAMIFNVIKVIGLIYLLYLAWGMWKDAELLQLDQSRNHHTELSTTVKGFLINILNPKLSLFFLAFLPQFVDPGSHSPVGDMWILSGLFMLMTLVIFIIYGLLAHRISASITASPKIMQKIQRVFALTFVGLGIKLIFTHSDATSAH